MLVRFLPGAALALIFVTWISAPASSPLSNSEGVASIELSSDPSCQVILKTVHVEIANSPEKRYEGLSFRTEPLAMNEGMLFSFPSPSRDVFVMRDTYIPLSLAFFDSNRRLLSTAEMGVEIDPSNPQKIYATKAPFINAIEAAPGTFAGLDPDSTYLCTTDSAIPDSGGANAKISVRSK
jgi:uncharacterized membrane protein (UPF0127 family)